MKIVHINAVDIQGGAARATYRLHKGLQRLGHDSLLFVGARTSNDSSVITFAAPMDIKSRLRRRFRRNLILREFAPYKSLSPRYELFNDDRSPYGDSLLSQLPPCDVINLHWIAGFVDYRAFFNAVPQRAPIVWLLHDMNPFTGGCHQDANCGKFTVQCGACPQLPSFKEQDLSRRIWHRKQAAFNNIHPSRLHFVAPSHWLAKEAKRSSLLKHFPSSVIPLGVDTEVFQPRDRGLAREVLGIPPGASVFLFVSDPITRVLKGFRFLVQALEELINVANLFLISVGDGRPATKIRVPHMNLGHIGVDQERLLSLVYSAADVFVIPSFQENLPQTVLEAMACGTPVIGSAVGGIPEMVRHGHTGLLVPPSDVDALRTAIFELVQDPVRQREMGANARRVAVEEYSVDLQAQRYAQLYESLIKQFEPCKQTAAAM